MTGAAVLSEKALNIYISSNNYNMKNEMYLDYKNYEFKTTNLTSTISFKSHDKQKKVSQLFECSSSTEHNAVVFSLAVFQTLVVGHFTTFIMNHKLHLMKRHKAKDLQSNVEYFRKD